MKKNIKYIAAAVLSAVLTVLGIAESGFSELVVKTATLSALSVMPEGIFAVSAAKNENDGFADGVNPPKTETVVGETVAAPITESFGVTEAVEECRLGNIIKKTLSPYNANTGYDGVYINNQCGEAVDIASDLAEKPVFNKGTDQPTVLIYHTHATEGYMSDESEYYTNRDEPRSTDKSKNVIKIGEIIAEELENAGIKVIHDETLHDYPGYTGSYSRSAETVTELLKKYPSIELAIDVHRDSISSGESDKVAPVVTVDGKEAAQVMLVMGSGTGSVENYPDWRTNLKVAESLQYIFENRYPSFARAILLKSSRYNQHLSKGSVLIEVGSDANTLEQAEYSARLVGKSLAELINS